MEVIINIGNHGIRIKVTYIHKYYCKVVLLNEHTYINVHV